jgi:CRISPR-associated Cas5-like protein
MKGIVVDIRFSEAHFKVHYTETVRLTYPVPLPPTVAGMFGAMLGWERVKYPHNIYCGARLVSGGSAFVEAASYHQYGKGKNVFGVASVEVLYRPEYMIAIATDDGGELEAWYRKLLSGLERLPYGGQNDFFVDGVEVRGMEEVVWSDVVGGYAPLDWVRKVDGEASILPVSYRGEPGYFVFAHSGTKIFLDRKTYSVMETPLYSLDDFSTVIG